MGTGGGCVEVELVFWHEMRKTEVESGILQIGRADNTHA